MMTLIRPLTFVAATVWLLGLGADAAQTSRSPIQAKCFPNGTFHLSGHTALIITTSHYKLGADNCTSCKGTGVFAEEMTAP
jgi:hypothetical protein